ncbi:methyltransferase domain-containing protein [uncultured Aquimarina sp.]|uniref:class I SAM-dependent methyltransferase n=1 Tax=uncultured Aquimarina sp. TaxID=575652 RepID=UPI00260985E0|nr:methyltransferase domain-containing protein [uncultured Aquimarina sp.]
MRIQFRNRFRKSLLVLVLLVTITSCKSQEKDPHNESEVGHKANEHMHKTPVAELIKNFDDESRDEWQKPDAVIAHLGDLKDKQIMDIGAGSGYFSFKFADAGAFVIAADVNDEFQEHIKNKRASLKIPEQRLETRKIPFDSPGLSNNEVDIAIIVNTYHHIENRISYFNTLKKGLKKDGKLVVVDYKKDKNISGPPFNTRMSAKRVIEELKKAGYTMIELEESLLPKQYIITAK